MILLVRAACSIDAILAVLFKKLQCFGGKYQGEGELRLMTGENLESQSEASCQLDGELWGIMPELEAKDILERYGYLWKEGEIKKPNSRLPP